MYELYHYYERKKGPFLNLSDLSMTETVQVLDTLKAENRVMAAQRFDGYLTLRKELEQLARRLFSEKGGKPIRPVPHTMVVTFMVVLLLDDLRSDEVHQNGAPHGIVGAVLRDLVRNSYDSRSDLSSLQPIWTGCGPMAWSGNVLLYWDTADSR